MSVRQQTPGFRTVAPNSMYGNDETKLRGIVLSEHAPNKNKTRWVACPTYDVLLIKDKHIIESVPYFSSMSGTSEVSMQRLQTSNAASIERVVQSTAGNGQPITFDELEGAGVLIEFADGMPFIRTCFPRTIIHSSKIPDGRAAADSDNDIAPDALDAFAERIANDPKLKDALAASSSYSVISDAQDEYWGVDDKNVPKEPSTANTTQKKAIWIAVWKTAWSVGFQNAYWSGEINAQDNGAVKQQYVNAEITEPNDDKETITLKENAWRDGFARGDIDGKKHALKVIPVVEAENPGAVIPENETTGDRADEEDSDWEQTDALGRLSVFYMERKGVRICVKADGTFVIDSRSSGQPILVQGGDNGVKITANGAVVDIGGDNDSTVRIKADKIDLGHTDSVTNYGVMWEPLKALLQKIVDVILTHTHDTVAAGKIDLLLETCQTTGTAGATTATLTLDDTPKSGEVRLT